MTQNGAFVVITGELDVDTLPQTDHTEHPVHPWYVYGRTAFNRGTEGTHGSLVEFYPGRPAGGLAAYHTYRQT